MGDNYEKLYTQSREHFLTFDQQPMLDWYGLDHDEKNIYFRLLGREAALDRATGEITCAGKRAGFNEACAVYDILSRAEKRPVLAGRWVGIVELGGNIASNHVDTLGADLSAVEGHIEEKKALCRSWGGIEQKQGDLSFIVPFTEFFPIWIQVWEGEEELSIPARFNCIWDANTLDFMFYETTWYARGFLLDSLRGTKSR